MNSESNPQKTSQREDPESWMEYRTVELKHRKVDVSVSVSVTQVGPLLCAGVNHGWDPRIRPVRKPSWNPLCPRIEGGNQPSRDYFSLIDQSINR